MEKLNPGATLVCVVDRDVWALRERTAVLVARGFRVLALGSVSAAMELVRSSRCTVLIASANLGETTGTELCERVRAEMRQARPGLVLLRDGATVGAEAADAVLDTIPTVEDMVLAITAAASTRPSGTPLLPPDPPAPPAPKKVRAQPAPPPAQPIAAEPAPQREMKPLPDHLR